MQEEQRIKALRDLRKKKDNMRKLYGKMKRLRELANNPIVKEYFALQEEIRTTKYIDPKHLNLANVIKTKDCNHEYFISVGELHYNASLNQVLDSTDCDIEPTHQVLMCLDCGQLLYIPLNEELKVNHIIKYSSAKVYPIRNEYLKLLEKGVISCEAFEIVKNKYDVSMSHNLTK